MVLTKMKKDDLINLFKKVDNARLLHGPDDNEALLYHGVMLGMRDELEAKGLEVEGVTGLWWYENLHTPKRQESATELLEKYPEREDIDLIANGSNIGIGFVNDILKGSRVFHLS